MTPELSIDGLGLFFADHHRALADRLTASAARIEELDRGPDSARDLARAMGAELGLYALLMPESGRPDVRALCLVRELLAQVSPQADAIFAVQGLGSFPLASTGGHGDVVARMRAGELIGGFALTEPEAGSDVASMQCRATRDGGDYVLTGDKTLISNVGIADQLVVFANIEPGSGKRGITAFLVEIDQPGIEIAPLVLNVDHPIGDVHLRECRVPASCVIGGEGQGFALAMATLDCFRVTVGAAAVGMACRALSETIAHVATRVQFGKPLAKQQLVQSYLGEMATELDAARLLVLRAAHKRDTGDQSVTTEAAMAKLYATEAAQRIVDKAVQLHGGRGVVSGQVVEMLYRAIRPLRIYEGTSEIQKLILGRALTRGAP